MVRGCDESSSIALVSACNGAEQDVRTYLSFPIEHQAKRHSTKLVTRLNGGIKRRTEVVGIFPNDGAFVRLVGALPLAQNEQWAVL